MMPVSSKNDQYHINGIERSGMLVQRVQYRYITWEDRPIKVYWSTVRYCTGMGEHRTILPIFNGMLCAGR
jgi:hypothetical protein